MAPITATEGDRPTESVTRAELSISDSGIWPRGCVVGSPPEAFDIQPLHADSEQLLASAEPTTWQWNVTARQEGRQRLTLIVYRLLTVDGQEYWRQIAYAQSIDVTITFGQRLARFDWLWLIGLLATGLIFPLLLGWFRRRGRKARVKA